MTSSEKTTIDAELIYLRGWYHAEGTAVVRADSSTGIEVLPDDRSPSARCHGFFHTFEERIRSAVFLLNNKLFLQVEQQRWDWLDDSVRIEHRRCGWGIAMKDSVFVYADDERRFAAVYTPPVAELLRVGDMTVDGIDETSDWWLWLSRVVADTKGREQLLACWQTGI